MCVYIKNMNTTINVLEGELKALRLSAKRINVSILNDNGESLEAIKILCSEISSVERQIKEAKEAILNYE